MQRPKTVPSEVQAHSNSDSARVILAHTPPIAMSSFAYMCHPKFEFSTSSRITYAVRKKTFGDELCGRLTSFFHPPSGSIWSVASYSPITEREHFFHVPDHPQDRGQVSASSALRKIVAHQRPQRYPVLSLFESPYRVPEVGKNEVRMSISEPGPVEFYSE